MGRFISTIAVAALVVTACSSAAAPTATPAPAAPTQAATLAQAAPTQPVTLAPAAATQPATPEPTATVAPVSAAVSFSDGKCTYTGPAVVPRGSTVNITLTNDPTLEGLARAELMVLPVASGTTWQMIVDDSARPDKLRDEPPSWAIVEEVSALSPEFAAAGRPLAARMSRDLYLVQCTVYPKGESPGGGRTPIEVYPAVLLKVLNG